MESKDIVVFFMQKIDGIGGEWSLLHNAKQCYRCVSKNEFPERLLVSCPFVFAKVTEPKPYD
jgi:hypothetical protein